MTTTTWPSTLEPQTFHASLKRAGLQFRSPFNGTAQAIDFVAERWVFSMTLRPQRRANAGAVEALLHSLGGGIDRVRCWHFFRPQPLGTMRGTPTLTSQVTRGATTLAITTTAGATLLAGDMIGLGGQLFMARDNATANGSGAMTLTTINRVRATIAAASAITWDAPTAEFVMPSMQPGVAYRPAILEGVPFDVEEWW